MSDWHDVMNAQGAAKAALSDCDALGGAIEDGRSGDSALALLLGARAVCLHLNVLAAVIDYNGATIANMTGRL